MCKDRLHQQEDGHSLQMTVGPWPGFDLQFLAYLVILCPHSPLHAREYLVLLGLVKYICDSFQLLTPAIFFGLRRLVVMKS